MGADENKNKIIVIIIKHLYAKRTYLLNKKKKIEEFK